VIRWGAAVAIARRRRELLPLKVIVLVVPADSPIRQVILMTAATAAVL